MYLKFKILSFTLLVASMLGWKIVTDKIPIQTLEVSNIKSYWDKSEPVGKKLAKKTIEIGSSKYDSGLEIDAKSHLILDLKGKSESLSGTLGYINSSPNKSDLYIYAIADQKLIFSDTLTTSENSVDLNLNLKGIKKLELILDPKNISHTLPQRVGLANTFIIGGNPSIIKEKKYILTPKESKKPKINAAKIFGVRPYSPVIFQVATSGARPMNWNVNELPEGLEFDNKTGKFSGKINKNGNYKIIVNAKNKFGVDTTTITFKVGDQISLTPPMGWNSWYSWSESVSQEKILKTANAFIDKDLINYGWTYVNIDDCWGAPRRGGEFNALMANERFPDMQLLSDQLHHMGLKIGIYSTLWMSSYAGFLGGTAPTPTGFPESWFLKKEELLQPGQVFGRHPSAVKSAMASIGPYWLIDNDVKQFNQWGIDYVKYDWLERKNQEELMEYVNKNKSLPQFPSGESRMQYPFNGKSEKWVKKLHDSFRAINRDIIISLSPTTDLESAPITSKYANLWRTTGDIKDTWESMSRSFDNDAWRKYAGNGHWNDPDMLQIGKFGVPNTLVRTLKETFLTPDEQYSQVSLWSLLSAPLLLSCDVESMDDFTLNLIKNNEVIAINQDEMGKQAYPIIQKDGLEVWRKDLANGDIAIGIFNRNYHQIDVNVNLEDLKIEGITNIRNVWEQKNLAVNNQIQKRLNWHGCALYRLSNK